MAQTPRAQRFAARQRDKNDDPNVGQNENEDPNVDRNAGNRRPNPVQVTVSGAGLDTYIPTIPEVRESDITTKFKVKTLTPIEGRPTYEKVELMEKELGRNALAIRVPFGGGKRGCLGTVYSTAKYQADAGTTWTVPETEGAYPMFQANATEADKKKVISEFIEREKGIRTVEVVEELLKGLFLDAIDEDYVVELKEGVREYDGRTLRELLQHLRKYAKMDDDVHLGIMNRFREAPDMELPVDKYFAKQEECRRMVADTENPLTDAAMVMQINQHIGKIPGLSKRVVKFKKKPADERKWANAKAFYREAVEDLEDENKALGEEPEMQANAATKIEQKVKDEISGKMSESFDALASAAVAKSTTIDNHANTIAQLTAAVAELTATNKRLVDQIVALGKGPTAYTAPPPGIPAIAPAPTAATQTGHALNTSGVACPVVMQRSGRNHFVTGQFCSTCGAKAARHVPQDCLALPQNAERKRKVDEMKARELAAAAAKKAAS